MSSADDHRSSNVKGLKYQSVLNMLALLLPGATLSYYGEEIALTEMRSDDDDVVKYASQLGHTVASYYFRHSFFHPRAQSLVFCRISVCFEICRITSRWYVWGR